MTRAEYIETYGPMAVEACREYPELYPSVLLAQAILESANGNSALAKRANNHFGIKKGVGWNGDVMEFNTREYKGGQWVTVKAPFRKYATVTDSFRDRNEFLKRNPRYAKHGVFAPRLDAFGQCNAIHQAECDCTVEEEAKSIFRAGYATDPEYADKLIALIDRHNLKRFDQELERQIRAEAEPKAKPEPPSAPAPEIPEVFVPYKPPVTITRPVDVPKIPIPEPPPVRKSWLDRLIAFIRERTK